MLIFNASIPLDKTTLKTLGYNFFVINNVKNILKNIFSKFCSFPSIPTDPQNNVKTTLKIFFKQFCQNFGQNYDIRYIYTALQNTRKKQQLNQNTTKNTMLYIAKNHPHIVKKVLKITGVYKCPGVQLSWCTIILPWRPGCTNVRCTIVRVYNCPCTFKTIATK